MQNAALSRQDMSLVLASAQKRLDFMDVAATMRRLCGSRGGAARQDFLIAADAGDARKREDGNAACVACKKAKNKNKWRREAKWGIG